MNICKKCGNEFEPTKGLINYCSLKCRNSKTWSDFDKLKKSESAKNSDKVKLANRIIIENNIKRFNADKVTNVCEICSLDIQTTIVKNEKVHKHCLQKDVNNKHRGFYVPRITNTCPVCLIDIVTTNKRNQKYHAECFKKISGGIRKNSGIGKSGWYKGYWCDSTYELAYVIYNLEHNINFTRNKVGFEYEINNEKHFYYPDFILENNMYVEIKGYASKLTDIKMDSFPHTIKILYKKDLKNVFDYVYEKYGKNFYLLYENVTHNKCQYCNINCKNKYCSHKCSVLDKKENYISINKGGKNKMVKQNELNNFLSDGWVKGRKLSNNALVNIKLANHLRKKPF